MSCEIKTFKLVLSVVKKFTLFLTLGVREGISAPVLCPWDGEHCCRKGCCEQSIRESEGCNSTRTPCARHFSGVT